MQRLRRRFVEDGFAAALSTCRTGERVCERKLDGAREARLLASQMAALERANAVSHETVRQVLKKRPQAAPEADVAHPAQAAG